MERNIISKNHRFYKLVDVFATPQYTQIQYHLKNHQVTSWQKCLGSPSVFGPWTFPSQGIYCWTSIARGEYFISTCEGEYFTTKNICNIHFLTHAGEYGRGGAIREGWLFASVLSTLQVLLSFKTFVQGQTWHVSACCWPWTTPKSTTSALTLKALRFRCCALSPGTWWTLRCGLCLVFSEAWIKLICWWTKVISVEIPLLGQVFPGSRKEVQHQYQKVSPSNQTLSSTNKPYILKRDGSIKLQ